jgi:hypothetical protein
LEAYFWWNLANQGSLVGSHIAKSPEAEDLAAILEKRGGFAEAVFEFDLGRWLALPCGLDDGAGSGSSTATATVTRASSMDDCNQVMV